LETLADQTDLELIALAMRVASEQGRRLTAVVGAARPAAASTPSTPASGAAMLTRTQVAKLLNVSKATVWRRLKDDGDFPKPIHVGKKKSLPRWDAAEIAAWCRSSKAAA